MCKKVHNLRHIKIQWPNSNGPIPVDTRSKATLTFAVFEQPAADRTDENTTWNFKK